MHPPHCIPNNLHKPNASHIPHGGARGAIDFDDSQLDTRLSDNEVSDRAIERVEREATHTQVSVAAQGNAKVRTVFVPVDADDGQFVLVPQGRVEVPTSGPSGLVTTVLDFDM